VRPDLPQPTHGLKEEDTFGGILFLRLKASHLRPKYRVLNGSHYALLRADVGTPTYDLKPGRDLIRLSCFFLSHDISSFRDTEANFNQLDCGKCIFEILFVLFVRGAADALCASLERRNRTQIITNRFPHYHRHVGPESVRLKSILLALRQWLERWRDCLRESCN